MGVLNVTPDSFSDGGKFNSIKKALAQAKKLIKEGADILDIGGESSGPNSQNVSLAEELNRVIPIIKALRKFTEIPISIDTYKSQVAEEALKAGANIINDVTALRGDKNMAAVAKKHQCHLILMYSKDPTARTTTQETKYKDVIATIKDFLKKQLNYAVKNGIKKSNLIIDPGMGGFISMLPKYSYEILARLKELKSLKLPILIGVSRKSFLGGPIDQRDQKSAALAAIAYLNGASIIRTHNITATKECLKWI